MEQSGANFHSVLGAAGSAEDGQVESPRSGVSGLSGLQARYRSFSPGGVVQSQQNQTMMLRSAAMQLAGGVGKDESQVVTRAILRKSSEALEEKMARQLRRANQEMSNTVDATLAGMEKRVSGTETVQKKLERRFAEVAGNWKGLSEEMQSQIRRSEQLDTRLGEVRRQVTEELRQRNMDFEQKLQKATSASRLGNTNVEEQVKRQSQRLQVVEAFLEERMKHEFEASETLGLLSTRIAALEDSHASVQSTPTTPTKAEEPEPLKLEGHPLLLSLQREIQSVTETLERTAQELHAQLGAQEERLNTLRTLHEAKDRDLIQQNQTSELEGKFELLRQQLHEKSLEKAEHADSLDLLHRKLVSQEQAHEELRSHFLRSRSTPAPGSSSVGGSSTPHAATPGFSTPAAQGMPPLLPVTSPMAGGSSLAGLEARIEDSEARIGQTVEKIVSRVEALQSTMQEMQKGEHSRDEINHLLEQLKGVAPRMVEHDLKLKDHHENHSGHQETLQEHASALARIQKAVDDLGETHRSVHQDVKEEFGQLWKKVPEDQLSVLISEVSSALEGCSVLQGEVKTLQHALSKVSQVSAEDFQQMQSDFRSAMQCCSKLQESVQALQKETSQDDAGIVATRALVSQDDAGTVATRDTVSEVSGGMASEVEQIKKICKDVQAEVATLRGEFASAASPASEALRAAPAGPGTFDAEGKHAELLTRVAELETRAPRPDAGATRDADTLTARIADIERAAGSLRDRVQGREETLLELQQRLGSCERRCDDLSRNQSQEEVADLFSRLREVESSVRDHRAATTAALEQGLAEHRAVADRHLAEHRSTVTLQLEQSASEQISAAERVLAENRAAMEQMRAEHRPPASDHGDLARRLEDFEKQFAEHRSTSSSQAEKADILARQIEQLEKQHAELRAATSHVEKAGDLAGRFDQFEKQLAEHRAATSQVEKADDLAGRLGQVEKQFAEHRTGLEQGLSEQRVAAEKAIAEHKEEIQRVLADHRTSLSEQQAAAERSNNEHKSEVQRALADHRTATTNDDRIKDLQGQFETLTGRISELSVAPAPARDEDLAERLAQTQKALEDQRSLTEKALGEHKADVERALAEQRVVAAASPVDGNLEKRIQEAEQALAEQKAAAPTQGRFQELERSHAALSDQVTKVGTSSEKVSELAKKLADLESKVEQLGSGPELAAEANVKGNIADGEGEKLLQLMNAVSQDDEAEHKTQKSVLSRIDEVCEHLLLVKSATDKAQLGANAGSPELSKQLEDTLTRVQKSEEWQKRVEEQIKELTEISSSLRPKPQDEEV